jgi:hypothetical protein
MKLAILLAPAALTYGTAAWGQSCSNSTIQGDYTFEVHGETLSSDGSTVIGEIDGVGVITFDGQGNLSQEDYVVRNGTEAPGGPPNPSGFHTGETGTYTINEDCTGSVNITLSEGNTRTEALVVTRTGTLHGVLYAATINGAPATLQVATNYQKIEPR